MIEKEFKYLLLVLGRSREDIAYYRKVKLDDEKASEYIKEYDHNFNKALKAYSNLKTENAVLRKGLEAVIEKSKWYYDFVSSEGADKTLAGYAYKIKAKDFGEIATKALEHCQESENTK